MPSRHYNLLPSDLQYDWFTLAWRRGVLWPLSRAYAVALRRQSAARASRPKHDREQASIALRVPVADTVELKPAPTATLPLPESKTLLAYRQVYSLWRQRLIFLGRNGWSVLNQPAVEGKVAKDPNHYSGTVMGNCPPIGVIYREGLPKSRPCCRGRACPFCWGRRVLGPLYLSLAAAYFKPGGEGDREPDGPAAGLDVVTIGSSRFTQIATPAGVPALAVELVRTAGSKEFRHADRLAVPGGVKDYGQVLTVAPLARAAGATGLIAICCTVLLVPPGTDLSALRAVPGRSAAGAVSVLPAGDVTRGKLSALAADVAPYPLSMMLGAPASAAAALNACSAAKLQAWVGGGLLRGSQGKDVRIVDNTEACRA